MPGRRAQPTTTHRRLVLVLAAALGLALPAVVPSPAAAATCGGLKSPRGVYFTSLKVSGITCAGGKDVMRGHYRCRVENGGRKGRCPRFNGWSCTERRQVGPTSYNARVVCRKPGRTVDYTYNQDT